MVTLTILDILYLVLIIFSTIIWTLLIVVLVKVLKILWPVVEIAEYYNKLKALLSSYASIPSIVNDSIKEKFTKEKSEK